MRIRRFHDSTSVGGYPVRGNTQRSVVPRKKVCCPFTTNCRPCTAISRKPNFIVLRSVPAEVFNSTSTDCSAGRNSSHGSAFLPKETSVSAVPPFSFHLTGTVTPPTFKVPLSHFPPAPPIRTFIRADLFPTLG